MAKFSTVVGSVVGNVECSRELLVTAFREAVTVFIEGNNSTGLKEAVIATGKTAKGKIIKNAIAAALVNCKVGFLGAKGQKFAAQSADDLAFWAAKIEGVTAIFSNEIETLGLKKEISEVDKQARADKLADSKAKALSDAVEKAITDRGLIPTPSEAPKERAVNTVLDMLDAGQVSKSDIARILAALDRLGVTAKPVTAKPVTAKPVTAKPVTAKPVTVTAKPVTDNVTI